MQSQSVRLVAGSGPIDGNEQATLPLTLENVDNSVRQCRVYVTGLPATWYELQPRDVALTAGESRQAQLTIQPPRAALGPHPFSVSARSETGLETLAFTLVIRTGGTVRVYPGPVTMQDRLAARSAVAARLPRSRRGVRRPGCWPWRSPCSCCSCSWASSWSNNHPARRARQRDSPARPRAR